MSAYPLAAMDWRELSEAASKEQDPNKLMELIHQLNEVLKRREEERSRDKTPERRDSAARNYS